MSRSVRTYSSETITAATHGGVLQRIVDKVAAGDYRSITADTVAYDDLPSAHRAMDANAYAGKVVVAVAPTDR